MFPELKWRRAHTDWQRSLASALSALASAEAMIPGLGVEKAPPRVFWKLGRWLVAEAVSLADDRLKRAFRSNGSPSWGPLLCRLFGKRMQVRSLADAIFLKSNLRAFYPSRLLTIKVANPDRPQALERIVRELECRRNLKDSCGTGPPALLYAEAAGSGNFLAEELIDTRSVVDTDISAAEIARRLVEFHRANGIEPVPLEAVCDIDHDIGLYRAFSAEAGLAVPSRITSLQQSKELRSGLVAAAVCNGDLTITNLMYGQGKLFITDWEWTERTIVFADAVRLATQLDGFADRFLGQFKTLALPAGDRLIEPTTQFLIAAIHVAARRVARRSDFRRPGSLHAYDGRLRNRVALIARLIETLGSAG